MGQVIGETDSRAERSINGQISFQNIMCTIYHVLGIDLNVNSTTARNTSSTTGR